GWGERLPGAGRTVRGDSMIWGGRSRQSETAERMRGPPGWTAQETMSAGVREWGARKARMKEGSSAAMRSGTRGERVISKPLSPMRQVMASVEFAKRREPQEAMRGTRLSEEIGRAHV